MSPKALLGQQVDDQPYIPRSQVEPGPPDVRSSTVVGPGRSYASAGDRACFTVQARDQHGNPCSSAGLQELLPLQVSGHVSAEPRPVCAHNTVELHWS